MSEPAPPEWLAAAIGAGATAFAAVLTWLGMRSSRKDPQDAVNVGFTDLLGQMRLELQAASKDRSSLRRLLEEERAEREQERDAWRAERDQFRGEIAQLQAVAEGFERLLRRNGIAIPERRLIIEDNPHHPPVQVVGTTLRQADGEDGT